MDLSKNHDISSISTDFYSITGTTIVLQVKSELADAWKMISHHLLRLLPYQYANAGIDAAKTTAAAACQG